jgi:uncharacterized protein YbaR (Trm112 family)
VFLELSEIFVCPSCRPAQGLVVLVDAIEERRVREGHLGCPECEMRVPIRDGELRFDRARPSGGERDPEGGHGADAARSGDAVAGAASAEAARGRDDPGEAGSGAALLSGVDPEEGATRLAALLGADGAEGCLLLGPGLGWLAAPLARPAGDAEVLALAPRGRTPAAAGEAADDGRRRADIDPTEPRVSRAAGVDPADLPIVTGRLAGVALLRPTAEAVREAVRVLEEGGRIVLVEPSHGARGALDGTPVRVAAAEEAAVVAVREPGSAAAGS